MSRSWLAARRCATLESHPAGDRGVPREQVLEVRRAQVPAGEGVDGAGRVGQGQAEQQRDVALDVAGPQHPDHDPVAAGGDAELDVARPHDPDPGLGSGRRPEQRLPGGQLDRLQARGQRGHIGRGERRVGAPPDAARDPRGVADGGVGGHRSGAGGAQRLGPPADLHPLMVSPR
jgi:hypothetical protein